MVHTRNNKGINMREKEYFTLPEVDTNNNISIVTGDHENDPDNCEVSHYSGIDCKFFNIFMGQVAALNQQELYDFLDTVFDKSKSDFHDYYNHSFIKQLDRNYYIYFIKDIILENIDNIEFKEPLTPVQCAKLRLKHG